MGFNEVTGVHKFAVRDIYGYRFIKNPNFDSGMSSN
jgi:hypothetical protein|tara:strand:- start:7 stop:114 length:108 start_codon:yes stop_codon:yes gene_type:complete